MQLYLGYEHVLEGDLSWLMKRQERAFLGMCSQIWLVVCYSAPHSSLMGQVSQRDPEWGGEGASGLGSPLSTSNWWTQNLHLLPTHQEMTYSALNFFPYHLIQEHLSFSSLYALTKEWKISIPINPQSHSDPFYKTKTKTKKALWLKRTAPGFKHKASPRSGSPSWRLLLT